MSTSVSEMEVILSAKISSVLLISMIGILFTMCRSNQPSTETPPNVVLILTDDQGWGDLSIHGNPYLQTPHIDQLARSGVQHSNFYVNPLCAPTRASLLTGRYNLRTGTRWVSDGLENMSPEEFTMAEMFKSANYATGCFGKWHNGAHYPFHPNQQGFDEFVGFCAGHWNNYYSTTLERNGEAYPTEGYITDVLTNEALKFIEEHQQEPFFCYIPYNVPHSPFQVDDVYFDKYYSLLDTMSDEAARNKLASVYGMCENIDDNVGRIVSALDSLSLSDNTIVIYLSDNGPNGERYNGGMRGTKSDTHEGGVKVPSFVSWPGHIPAGTVRDAVAAHIDLFPTLASLCKIELPDNLLLDGINLADWWQDVRTELPKRTLFVQQSDRLLTPDLGGVRTDEYRYVIYPDYTGLYHLPTDPGEKHDLSQEQPVLADSMHRLYTEWFEKMKASSQDFTVTPVGFPGQRRIVLPAHESKFSGKVQFKEGHGWAHDWLVNWTKPQDSIWWDVEVKEASTYDVALSYTCPASDLGSTVRITTGTDQATATVERAYDPEHIPSPDRVPRQEVYEKEWAQLPLGTVRLAPGHHRLVLQALDIPHQQVLELKNITLTTPTSSTL